MSKYTEEEINNAIKIVQAALEDNEIEYRDSSDTKWSVTYDVDNTLPHRANKKQPREYWVAIGEDFYEIEKSERYAREYQDALEVIKVREVLEGDD